MIGKGVVPDVGGWLRERWHDSQILSGHLIPFETGHAHLKRGEMAATNPPGVISVSTAL
jgi:hypothetical protein